MCGRYTLFNLARLIDMFPWISPPADELSPRYNIAPTQPVPVIANVDRAKLDSYLWGLIPSWAKDPKIGNRMINARSETLASKPAFRVAYRRRRCLLPADGFYEWKKDPDGKTKTPYYVRLKTGEPFAFAGLWESWHPPEGQEIRSCTIITVAPNTLLETLHDRMPAIVQRLHYERWLDPGDKPPGELEEVLVPYAAEPMEAYAVTRAVNSPRTQGPQCIEPSG